LTLDQEAGVTAISQSTFAACEQGLYGQETGLLTPTPIPVAQGCVVVFLATRHEWTGSTREERP
jgi:hypothetical protein